MIPNIQPGFQDANGVSAMSQGVANSMTLILTNHGDPIPLRGGAPSQFPSGFAFSIDFSQYFTDAANAAGIEVSGDGYTVEGTGNREQWALFLNADTVWSTGDSISIAVTGIAPDVPIATYSVMLILTNVGESYGLPYSISVAVQKAPSTELKNVLPVVFKLTPATGVGGLSNQIYITKTTSDKIYNSLILEIDNVGGAPLVSSGSWGSLNPVFILSFVCAEEPGSYAVTNSEALQGVTLTPMDSSLWQANTPTGTPPTFPFRPTDANVQILGTGSQAIAQFQLTGLMTQLVAGPAMMYLQYSGIPGYNDGMIGVSVRKIYESLTMPVLGLNQTQAYPVPDIGYATGYLNWSTSGAAMVQLESVPPVPALAGAPYGSVPTVQGSYPVAIRQNQTFILTAFDPFTCSILSAKVTATTNPPIELRWVPIGAIVAWKGDAGECPDGFTLCNGQNGAPDLSGRFVVGSWPADPNLNRGGTDTHTHVVTSPATILINAAGNHSHPMDSDWGAQIFDDATRLNSILVSTPYDSYDHTQDGGTHVHTMGPPTISTTSEVPVGNTRPPWYALYYIMKTG